MEAISACAPHLAVLTGSVATPAAALAAMNGAAVVHVAPHGLHQAENPLFSTLELSGGSIFGYDLQRLTRPPALIMLSSCELGLNDVRPGNELFLPAGKALSMTPGGIPISRSFVSMTISGCRGSRIASSYPRPAPHAAAKLLAA